MTGGHAWWGVYVVGGVWQERQPLQRAVSILLECILVVIVNVFNELIVSEASSRHKIMKYHSSSSIPPKAHFSFTSAWVDRETICMLESSPSF